MEELKELICDYVKKLHIATFNDLEELLCRNNIAFNGDKTLAPEENRHAILWSGLNEEVISVLAELVREKRVFVRSDETTILLYMYDGKGQNLPIGKAQNMKKYKTNHWIPAVLSDRQ